jgi:hypothetical protein
MLREKILNYWRYYPCNQRLKWLVKYLHSKQKQSRKQEPEQARTNKGKTKEAMAMATGGSQKPDEVKAEIRRLERGAAMTQSPSAVRSASSGDGGGFKKGKKSKMRGSNKSY